ncbi:MAG: hypothetical protein M5U26_03245 [Planctomycetota bacterium]|nr:hypothetical protein [Planctomycetota bacterium]
MRKTLILAVALVLCLALPSFAVPVAPRHASAGAFGPHGIRNRLDFNLNTARDGRDRLSVLLDLGHDAFDSARPEIMKHRLVTLTLSLDAGHHEHGDLAAEPRDHPASWTFEDLTDDLARIRTAQARAWLVRRGTGFSFNLYRASLDDLKEMLEAAGPVARLHLTLSHNHPPHGLVAERHATTLYEGEFEVRLRRGPVTILGRGTPVDEEEESHGAVQAAPPPEADF